MTTLGVFAPGYHTAAESVGAGPSRPPSANVEAIQKALDGGGTVRLTEPGIYDINDTLRIGSNTELILGAGVTIRNAASNTAFRNMIVNTAYLASSSSVSITSSSLTATVTWPGHGKAVGDWISILGANQSEYNGIFKVATVTNANTFTYTMLAAASATPATGTVVAKAADSNIRISGGKWDYNNTALSGADANTRHAIILGFCYAPIVAEMAVENVQKYGVFMPNVREIVVRSIRFNTPSDGVHLQGCTGALIEDLGGYCGDDMVSMTCGDFSQYDVAKALHRGVKIRNLVSNNCPLPLIKIAGGPHRFKDVEVDGVYGVCGNAVVSITEDTNLAATYVEQFTIKNVFAGWGSANPLVGVARTTTSCNVDRLTVADSTIAMLTTQKLIQVTQGAAVIGCARIAGCDVNMAGITGGTYLIGGVSTSTITEARIESSRIVGATANATGVNADGTITRIFFAEMSWETAGKLFDIQTTASTPEVFISNSRTTTTNNPAQFRKAGFLYTSNWKHSGSTAVNIIGPGTVVWEGNLDTANTYVGTSGGAVLSVNGQQLAVDAALVTLRAGDMFYNTNAGALTGAGLYGVSAASAAVKLT